MPATFLVPTLLRGNEVTFNNLSIIKMNKVNYPDLKEGASSFNRAMLGIMRSLKSLRLAVPDIPSGRLNYQHGKNRTRMQRQNQEHSYIPHLKEGVLRTKWIKKPTKNIFWVISSLMLLTACNPGNIKQAENRSHQETEDILQSAGLNVTSVDEAIVKAEKALQSGKTDLAQLYYIKAYNLEPDNVQVLQKMADLYIGLKKYDLAEVSFKLIVKQQPDDVNTAEQYGLLLIKRGKYPDAAENLNRVIAKRQSWRAYNGLGIIANLQGEPLKAETLFKKADNILPNSPELLNNIGFALYSADKLDEAASYYSKALQINPGFKKAIYNYGLLQARLKHYEQAYTAFAKVASPAEAHNNIGYIAMMNGDYPEANNYLQEAIKLSPRFYKKANDNLARLEMLEKQ